jgi:hypothetical protein
MNDERADQLVLKPALWPTWESEKGSARGALWIPRVGEGGLGGLQVLKPVPRAGESGHRFRNHLTTTPRSPSYMARRVSLQP